ncbi:rab-GTPase-TBC domain-containing protein [Pilobolus umbonatus]|nr:rab-GTPase-TBC domain-containing protein [Pilobolus umbonatus]
MALFANAIDLKRHTNEATSQLASINFVASNRVTKALAQSGHLALSAPSQIIGQFQYLKTLKHPYICEYVEIHRGKHDRLFVVSEYNDASLQKTRNLDTSHPTTTNLDMIKRWAFEMFSALHYLEERGVVHGSLSPNNILLDPENHIKLFGYGLNYMTNGGRDVDFPIGYPPYLSAECLLQSGEMRFDKRDTWAVGIILVEQYTRNSFWTTSDIGLIFDSLMTLKEWHNENPDGNIWLHDDIETLDINKIVLRFLQGRHEDNDEQTKIFHQFIIQCLQLSVERRYYPAQALSSSPFMADYAQTSVNANNWRTSLILASEELLPDREEKPKGNNHNSTNALQGLPIAQIYNLWKLAGGDVEIDLMKRGVFLSTPVIKQLPRVCMISDGKEIGDNVMDISQLYSDTIYVLSFKELYQRLKDRKKTAADKFEWDTDYFLVVDENDVNFLLEDEKSQADKAEEDESIDDFVFVDDSHSNEYPAAPLSGATSKPTSRKLSMTHMNRARSASSLSLNSTASVPNQSTTPKLPLFLREQDINYQYYRQTLFSQLLRQYPASEKEISHHAKTDIPPLLRGKIWAAVLGVKGDIEYEYDQINKCVDIYAERQIDVDVPRCHQYNQLLASSTGHEKLRRLLKAWVSVNKDLVYWQGLDSICAPFLTLNFNDEALAFASLQKFIPKFLNNLFLSDNNNILQDYLAVFKHLLSFHDPELSAHLNMIGYTPDLYAIPWFLTLFTHVFPLDKIYHLWDKILVGPASLPLFAGIAILRQVRDTLLSYEFNDCLSLISDSFSNVDIEKCIQSALTMCKVTPPSISTRVHGPMVKEDEESNQSKSKLTDWWENPIPLETKQLELAPRISVTDLPRILSFSLVLDIRPDTEFVKGHVPSSINVQSSQLDNYAQIIRKLNRKYHLVIGDEGGPQYSADLVNRHFPRAAYLHGGLEAFKSKFAHLCTCRPQKQTTAGFKGKGSEPPFIMWRCKTPVTGSS